MPRPYQVERDRFGTMYSGPLEVGEMVEVVPLSVARELRDALEACLTTSPYADVGERRAGRYAVRKFDEATTDD